MDVLFVHCAEEVVYQRRLAALLADWRRDKVVTTVPDVAFFSFHADGSQL